MSPPDAEEWVQTYLHFKKICSSLKIFNLKTQSFRKNTIFGINRKNSPLKSCRKLLIFDANIEKMKILKNSSNIQSHFMFDIFLPGAVKITALQLYSFSLRQNNFYDASSVMKNFHAVKD